MFPFSIKLSQVGHSTVRNCVPGRIGDLAVLDDVSVRVYVGERDADQGHDPWKYGDICEAAKGQTSCVLSDCVCGTAPAHDPGTYCVRDVAGDWGIECYWICFVQALDSVGEGTESREHGIER